MVYTGRKSSFLLLYLLPSWIPLPRVSLPIIVKPVFSVHLAFLFPFSFKHSVRFIAGRVRILTSSTHINLFAEIVPSYKWLAFALISHLFSHRIFAMSIRQGRQQARWSRSPNASAPRTALHARTVPVTPIPQEHLGRAVLHLRLTNGCGIVISAVQATRLASHAGV